MASIGKLAELVTNLAEEDEEAGKEMMASIAEVRVQ